MAETVSYQQFPETHPKIDYEWNVDEIRACERGKQEEISASHNFNKLKGQLHRAKCLS